MASECSNRHGTIHLNVHRFETVVVLFNFAVLVVLAFFAYRPQRRGLVLVALAAAVVGALALPVLERSYLRNWPRYAARPANAKPQPARRGRGPSRPFPGRLKP
jgi:hypothetical protein